MVERPRLFRPLPVNDDATEVHLMSLVDAPVSQSREVTDSFRHAMAQVATPVSIVTAIETGVPHGTTVSAFASLSMDPPMLLISLDRRSDLLEIVRRTGAFGVNVLAAHQADMASVFARRGVDRFAGLDWQVADGLPRLGGSAVWVACELRALTDGGDHEIALGVVRSVAHEPAPPLTYHARRFGTHAAAA